MKAAPKRRATAAANAPTMKEWDEERFQMLMRVVGAITFDKTPGVRVIMLAECLAQTMRQEIPRLTRARSRPRSKRAMR